MLMEILLWMWSVLSSIPWWVYVLWYLCGVWAMGAMLSVQLWDMMSYEDSARWFWVAALGGGLFLLLALLNGDLSRGFIIPGPWARRRAEKIRQNYEEYRQMLQTNPSLPRKYGLRRWDEIWGREKLSHPI